MPSHREPPVDGAGDQGTVPTAESRPPAALDPPMVPFAVGGIIVWAIVGLALLPFRDRLDAHGHGSWLAICLAGFLWGFVGLAVMVRHDARRRRRRADTADDAAARPD